MERPSYSQQPIYSVAALCRALGESEDLLCSLAERIPQLYIGPKKKLKKDGKTYRHVYDTKPPLKQLLKKINHRIFEKVQFPQYLQGSLKGRDFVGNVAIHEKSQIVICEDVEKFFDNISAESVFRIWRDFFQFGNEPAELLTALTTRDGHVFQGTPTSSYLANLAFWDIEGILVANLADRGLRYSRYVDDITISSTVKLESADKKWAISQVIAMMGSRGFRAARDKHSIQSAKSRISVMNLNVNQQVGLSRKERANIRAGVHQLEQRFGQGETGLAFQRDLDKARGRIGRMARFHPSEAEALRLRLQAMRDRLI
ncbi:MAG: reverse transcriptase family protein [Leptothrix ochracea]|uniref:reverse transcriptase family protein n=1 Tax=Leptothrix ochracea TaxID=735331 RepID=UPI0034E2BF13